ncbi:unnamed protein product, partial [Brachionus calyciflorus]
MVSMVLKPYRGKPNLNLTLRVLVKRLR